MARVGHDFGRPRIDLGLPLSTPGAGYCLRVSPPRVIIGPPRAGAVYVTRIATTTVFSTPLARLRLVGILEGVSFLVLLGIAMPLKYLAGLPQAVRVVGSLHGVLFLLFLVVLARAAVAYRWPLPRVLGAVVAAVLPFGPFVLDARLRREGAA